MPHAHTAHLLEEWRRRRGPSRRLPARTELSPLLFGPLLPQMFILAEDAGAWRFRVAGALLGELHGCELRGLGFPALWAFEDRPGLMRALEQARGAAEPRILACRGETATGRSLALEMTLAPVTGPTEAPDRVLGLYQPLSLVARLMGEPLDRLSLSVGAEARGAPALRVVVDNTRPRPLG